MNTRKLALFAILAAIVWIGGSVLVNNSLAQNRPGWVSFDGTSSPAAPQLVMLHSSSEAPELQASLPGAQTETILANGTAYTRLLGEGFGFPSEIGKPELPVLRQEVEIPFGAQVSLELLSAEYIEASLGELGLGTIYPLQAPLSKQKGEEAPPFTLDGEAYSQAGFAPASPLQAGEPYIVRGHRLLMLEIWPVAYDPVAGRLRLYSQLTFRLKLEGADLTLTRQTAQRYASPEFERSLDERVLNFNLGLEQAEVDEVGYLIITADDFYDAILPLAALRTSRGFDVTVTRLSELPGSSKEEIKAYIQEAYDTWALPPSYLLLVGDTDTIPTWLGPRIETSTDLYYATMDGESDWHPDLYRGRFPVRSAEQTKYMVDKYLAYAQLTGIEPWLKTVSFPATCDMTFYPIAEGTHNDVISAYTLPGGWTGTFPQKPQPGGDKLYCITYGAANEDLVEAFDQGRWAIIYSGHGEFTGWEMGFDQDDVRNLTNFGRFPVVISHACLTGDFAQEEVFGETWVLQENRGALAYFGSTTITNWPHDDTLERGYTDRLFDDSLPPVDLGTMIDTGLAAVEKHFTGQARYYWEAYHLLGDPAAKLFLQPDSPTYTLSVEPENHNVCTAGSLESTVQVGSALDYTEVVSLEHGTLPLEVSASFEPASAAAPFVSIFSLEVAPGALPADYSIPINASDGLGIDQSITLDLRVVDQTPLQPIPLLPADGSLDQSLQPTFGWASATLTDTQHLQLSDSPLFETLVLDAPDLGSIFFQPELTLDQGSCYWWQVRSGNACGDGAWSQTFHFATRSLGDTFFDDMEAGEANWSHTALIGADNWVISSDSAYSPEQAWYVPNDKVISDSSLWITNPLLVQPGSSLSFWHRYMTEYDYDGAVIEISTDGGETWQDLGPQITANGYTGVLSTEYENPLGGREAWTGNRISWTEVTVDLDPFAGQLVNIRWRMGCDSSLGAPGWYIDDVRIHFPLPLADPPSLVAVTPSAAAQDELPGSLVITGTGFSGKPSLKLGEYWLAEVQLLDSNTLSALLPAGLLPGTYDLTLHNGDCQAAVVEGAFTVTGGEQTHILFLTALLK